MSKLSFFVPALPRREVNWEGSAKATALYLDAFTEMRGEVYTAALEAGQFPDQPFERPVVWITITCKRRGRDGRYRPLSIFEAQAISKPVIRALAELQILRTEDAEAVAYRLHNSETEPEGLMIDVREAKSE